MKAEPLAVIVLVFIAMCIVYSLFGTLAGEIFAGTSVILTFLLLIYANSFKERS